MQKEPEATGIPYVTRAELKQTEEQVKRKWKILLTLLALALRVTPREEAAEAKTGAVKAVKPAAGAGVLVIDVDPASSGEISSALQIAGFEAIAVSGPDEAFKRLGDASLVILDETVPGIAEVCSRIRAQSEAPIILMGSKPGANAWNQAVLLGADAYLGHSVSRKELVARIRAILRRYPHMNFAGGA